MKTHELRQIRNEAAVSDHFRVPRECLSRANCLGNVCECKSIVGVQHLIYKIKSLNRDFFIKKNDIIIKYYGKYYN